jgi:hypothetical protein
VLIKCGRADDAYHRYGLKTATGPTYLAIFRDTVKRYPDRDSGHFGRGVLGPPCTRHDARCFVRRSAAIG